MQVGRGIRSLVNTRAVWVDKPELFAERGCSIPDALAGAASECAARGMTTVFVGDESGVLGLLAIADILRPSAREAIDQLRRLGIEHLLILTGDHPNVARVIAETLGLDYKAGLLPEQKMLAIKELQSIYGMVAMVGDGINDAPSLATAALGISLGGAGTDVALKTAAVVLMADDLRHLPYALALAREAERIIRQSLLFACAVIVGLLGVAFLGSLGLPYAVAGHEGSTVLVILNGLRLLAFPRPSSVAQSQECPIPALPG
ncbi:MAG: HAD-IC family P-type ATPase [Isosphaeraceae bacterium]|nr:HAD-IC family P-type ATPase [Isosphaeraceae bacterium]